VGRSRVAVTRVHAAQHQAYIDDINELAVVRAWGIYESYLANRADDLLRRELPVSATPNAVVQYVHTETSDAFERSFESLRRFWKEGLGVSGPTWDAVAQYKWLRNLIVHGVGYARPRPGAKPFKPPVAARLKVASLRPQVYRVPIYDSDFVGLLTAVRVFVRWAERTRP
jgi:hypothetical protein